MDINDKSRIPIFAVVAAVPIATVAIVWLVTAIVATGAKAQETSTRVDRVVEKIHRMDDDTLQYRKETMSLLIDLRERSARIEQKLLDIGK